MEFLRWGISLGATKQQISNFTSSGKKKKRFKVSETRNGNWRVLQQYEFEHASPEVLLMINLAHTGYFKWNICTRSSVKTDLKSKSSLCVFTLVLLPPFPCIITFFNIQIKIWLFPQILNISAKITYLTDEMLILLPAALKKFCFPVWILGKALVKLNWGSRHLLDAKTRTEFWKLWENNWGSGSDVSACLFIFIGLFVFRVNTDFLS